MNESLNANRLDGENERASTGEEERRVYATGFDRNGELEFYSSAKLELPTLTLCFDCSALVQKLVSALEMDRVLNARSSRADPRIGSKTQSSACYCNRFNTASINVSSELLNSRPTAIRAIAPKTSLKVKSLYAAKP